MNAVCGTFISFCDRIGQRYAPGRYLFNPWIEMVLVAAVFMLLLLVFTKYAGFCSRLGNARREMLAAAYEILLYRRRPRTVLIGELKLICANLKFLAWLTPSLVFAGVLFAGMYNTLSNRYGYAPAAIGKDIVVKTKHASGEKQELSSCRIDKNKNDLAISARVTVPSVGATWTRVAPLRAGLLALDLGRENATAALNVESSHLPAMPRQYDNGLEIWIGYPRRKWWGSAHGWLVYFLVASTAVAVPLARRLKVSL